MQNIKTQKVTINCDKAVLALLGLIIGKNFNKLIDSYKVKVNFSDEEILELKNIIHQMQHSIYEGDFHMN